MGLVFPRRVFVRRFPDGESGVFIHESRVDERGTGPARIDRDVARNGAKEMGKLLRMPVFSGKK